jgi:hypothetical protein
MSTAPEPPAAGSYAGRMADDTSKRPALVFDDPLSQPSRDDTDSGWGEGRGAGGGESERDEAWYRRETPPHHGG